MKDNIRQPWVLGVIWGLIASGIYYFGIGSFNPFLGSMAITLLTLALLLQIWLLWRKKYTPMEIGIFVGILFFLFCIFVFVVFPSMMPVPGRYYDRS